MPVRVFPLRRICLPRSFFSENIIAADAEIIRKRNNVRRFRFVDPAFPKIDRFLAYADRLCQRRLRQLVLHPQFLDRFGIVHVYILVDIYLKCLTK